MPYKNQLVSVPVRARFTNVDQTSTKFKYDLDLDLARDLRSFVIRFDFESYVRFEIRFVLMVRFEIFESSALSIIIRKEMIGGG